MRRSVFGFFLVAFRCAGGHKASVESSFVGTLTGSLRGRVDAPRAGLRVVASW